MKSTERDKAIDLRRQQWTYSEIAKSLNVSKGSLSRWLRTATYSPRLDVIEKINQVRMQNTYAMSLRLKTDKSERVTGLLTQGQSEIHSLGLDELRIVGAMAYWAEGSKTLDSVVKFTNTDPQLILLMIRWFKEVCNVPSDKLRLHVRVHPGEDVLAIERMWAAITEIPQRQFYRTTIKTSASGGATRRKIRWGIVSIIVCDTKLFYRIQGWIGALKATFLTAESSPLLCK